MIRKALIEDLPILHHLVNQLGYPLNLAIFQKTVESYLADVDRAIYVAEVEGEVTGCLALDIAQTFHRHQPQMTIISLVIDSSMRGKGIGTQLLKAAEQLAVERKCWVIELVSSTRRKKEGTHDFYIRHGYQKNGEQAYFRKLISFHPHQP